MKLEEICPYCGDWGEYKKGWDMKQRKQVKGEARGTYKPTGRITRIRLYKCKYCQRNFRKGETLEQGG